MTAKLGPFKVEMTGGGPFEAGVFDDATRTELSSVAEGTVSAESELSIVWRDGRFLLKHWLLGPVEVHLRQQDAGAEAGAPAGASGTVRPVRRDKAGGAATGFFPAFNENELFFDVMVPRFRARFSNQAPVRNSAEITAIPPVGSPYAMHEPTAFQSRSWLPWQLKIVDCVVQTLAEENLDAEVVDVTRAGDRLIAEVDVTNRTGEDEVEIAWALTTDPPIEASRRAMGHRRLDRNPARIRIDIDASVIDGDCDVCFRAGVVRPERLAAAGSDGRTGVR